MLHGRRGNGCFRLDDRGELIHAHAQLGQLGVIQLDIDFFRLNPQQFHFFYVRHQHKLILDPAGHLPHLFIGKAVGGDCVDVPEYVIKVVVEKRPVQIGRQCAPAVVHQVPYFLPAQPCGFRGNRVLQVYVDYTGPGARVTGNIVHVWHGLYDFFDFIGNLHLHLLRSSSRPGSGYNHLLDSKIRIFLASQYQVGKNAHNGNKYGKKVNNLLMFNRPFRPVCVHFVSLPSSRTSCPSANLLTPPVTTTSPLARPPAIITLLPS